MFRSQRSVHYSSTFLIDMRVPFTVRVHILRHPCSIYYFLHRLLLPATCFDSSNPLGSPSLRSLFSTRYRCLPAVPSLLFPPDPPKLLPTGARSIRASMARPPPFFLLVTVFFFLGPRSSIATAATVPPPTVTTVPPPSAGLLNVGTVACLTADARNLLVQQCHDNALKMKKYSHVASCFDSKLRDLTGNSTSSLGQEVLICMEQSQIINSLMSCAINMDPNDIPASPVPSAVMPTTQRSLKRRPKKRRRITDIFPSMRDYTTPTFAGKGRKYVQCTKEFPCCLFATGIYIGKCFAHNCMSWPDRC